MKLSAEQEATILAGARAVVDDQRDRYFQLVADALRGSKRLRNSDVKSAVCSATGRVFKAGAVKVSN